MADKLSNSLSDAIANLNTKASYYQTVALTPKNGTLNNSAWAKRIDRVVSIGIEYLYTGTTASNWVQIVSFPASAAPYGTTYFPVWDNVDKKAVFGYVDASGNIGIHSPINNHSYYCLLTFIAHQSA